jgi:hypothetical protein
MAKDKKSFIAYCDWLESFDELSDTEAGRLVKHLFRYVNDMNPEAPDKLTKMCFIPIQQSLKRDLKKYDGYIDKQRENGLKGGRPPKPKEPTALFDNPTEPKKADSVSVSVSDSVNASETKQIPAYEVFKDYANEVATERNLTIDQNKLKLKYEAWKVNDWKNGNNKKILNWKSTLLNTLVYLQGDSKVKKPFKVKVTL